VNLTNATRPTTKQECEKRVIIEEENAMTKEDLEDDPTLSDSTGSDETKVNNDTEDVEVDIPNELKSDLISYWVLAQSWYALVLNTISSYSNIEASKSTPQYGFN
jgi:hypothetical protein